MKKKAKFWTSINNKDVQCLLCAHKCIIKEGMRGICGVRVNEDGHLFSLIYGSSSSMAVDPIEKKPFFHFYPGMDVLSFGTVGCNFKCDHCQNSSISAAQPEGVHLQETMPNDVVDLVRRYRCAGVAWTYNEPTIWHEFTFDSSKLIKKAGFSTMYVTNGYINEEPLKELSPHLDAMNIDVKAFNEKFYKQICKAKLEPVLNMCECAKELGIHIELTYLVIPNHNDSADEIENFCKWVVDKLSSDTPVHFSRFRPDYKMIDVPSTPIESLLRIYETAKNIGILYPYLGNVPHDNYENTICPSCGNICVERHGFSANLTGYINGKCAKCGNNIPILSDTILSKK